MFMGLGRESNEVLALLTKIRKDGILTCVTKMQTQVRQNIVIIIW